MIATHAALLTSASAQNTHTHTHIHSSRCTGRRFAVFVTGVIERFVLESTLRHVVAPAAKDGWCVDYFLQLSGAWDGQWLETIYSPGIMRPQPVPSPYTTMSREQFTAIVLKQALIHGANYINIRLNEEGDEIDQITPDHMMVRGKRLHAYPPLTSKAGQNQLRRLKSIEELWNRSVAYTGSSTYDYIMLSRDDVHWAADVNLSWFAQDSKEIQIMYTYYCGNPTTAGWLGDKVRIMTGGIAGKMMHMYSDIYYNLDTRLNGVHTAEDLLHRTAILHDVTSVQVKLSHFPFYVAQYFELEGYGVTLCLRYARTTPCVNASTHDVMHGRFGPACFLDPARRPCMGALKLTYPGCAIFARGRYDTRLDYR